jgi:hypothetical protein
MRELRGAPPATCNAGVTICLAAETLSSRSFAQMTRAHNNKDACAQ